MSREAKWFCGFGCVLLAAFVAEHIWLVTRPDRLTVDPNPTCTVRMEKH